MTCHRGRSRSDPGGGVEALPISSGGRGRPVAGRHSQAVPPPIQQREYGMSRTWKDSPLGPRVPRQGEVERREQDRPLLYVIAAEVPRLLRSKEEIARAYASSISGPQEAA
jgi:hypothetical protein